MNDKEKFRIMIQLALVDNQFEDAERDFIHSLANKSSLSSEELEDIIQEELQKKKIMKWILTPTWALMLKLKS